MACAARVPGTAVRVALVGASVVPVIWPLLRFLADGGWVAAAGLILAVVRHPIAPDDDGPWTRLRFPWHRWWRES